MKAREKYLEVMRDAKPDPAHIVIKKLEDMAKLLASVTCNKNIDTAP